jgi:signal transduction histidine kinase
LEQGGHLFEGGLLTLLFFAIAMAFPVSAFITNTPAHRCRSLSLTALFLAVYTLSSSGLGAFIVSSSILWHYFALTALGLIPAGICSFIREVVPAETPARYLYYMEKIYLLFAVASLLGVAANIATASWFLQIFFMLVAITYLCVVTLMIRAIRTGRRHAEPVLFGFMAFLGLSTLPVLSQALSLDLPFAYPILWGMLILLISLITTVRLNYTAALQQTPPPSQPVASAADAFCPRSTPEPGENSWKNSVSSFTHEVNTPLGTGLLTATHLQDQVNELYDLFRNGELKKSDLEKCLLSYKEAADILITNLQSAAELVRSFKQEAAAAGAASKQTFPVDIYLKKIITGLTPRIRQAGHQLHYSCPPDLCIHSHPILFSQIISNLVVNSLTHAYPSGVTGNLSLAVTANTDTLQIKFSDDGNGIDPQLLGRIFEPYFTSSSASGNNGLGLFVVHSLVTQRMGGSIDCTSVPGQGTTFTLKFPIERR